MPDQTLEEMAADASLVAYKDAATGQIVFKPRTADAAIVRQRQTGGLIHATPEDIERRSRYIKNTETLAQLKSAGKLAARTATFGNTFDTPEDSQQIKDFSEASPTLSTLTKVAGAAAPALVAGPIAGSALGSLGLAPRAAQLGATVVEELAGNSAFEVEDATEQDRDISLGNIIAGVGLGTAATVAGRYATGAARRALGTVMDAEASPLARAVRTSEERRSAGAMGAGEHARPPATASEVTDYAMAPEEFHAQVNQVSHDALADAFTGHAGVTGESGGAARQVHGLAFKYQDVAPHMTDVPGDVALDAVYEHASAAMSAAEVLDAAGQKLAAKRLVAAAQNALEGIGADESLFAARGAVGLNNLKREADDILGNYLRNRSVTAKSAAKEIEKFVEPLRRGLEDRKTWGDFWADRQVGENRLWAGDDGIIQLSNIWQPEVFEAVKGKARVRIGDVLSEVSNRTPRADIAEHIMGLPEIKARKVLDSWESTVDQWRRMTELKKESGLVRPADALGGDPVETLTRSLDHQQRMIDELRFLRDAGPRAKPIIAKQAARAGAQAQGELLFDIIPGAQRLDRAAELATGRGLKDRLFKAEPLPPARTFTREQALEEVTKRQGRRGGGPAPSAEPPSAPPTPPKPGAPPTTPSGAGGAGAAAAVLGIGGLAVAASPTTDALSKVSKNANTSRERAALGMAVPATRPAPLPSSIARFQGEHPDLETAFTSRLAALRGAQQDPRAFIDAMTDTFGEIGMGGHNGLFSRLVARTQIATDYVLANAPPSVGISMIKPNGSPPDVLAICKWAEIYDAAFSPGDAVHDVGTGRATPTQIKTLREVHPDIFGALRADVLQQVAVTGAATPFDTLVQLDVLFGIEGVAGPSFGSGMAKTLAAARTNQSQTRPSLAGESSIAPTSADSPFSKGPTALQA